MNYYNENDKNCVAWLKGLIAEKLIPAGDVDDRDIRDVRPVDLRAYTQCHFFAGIGGWPLALAIAGVGPDEPLWTGSCPCQPFSAAGRRGGFADERHLWPSFYHLIAQCRPAVVLGEQVASAAEWLRLVRGDLEALDYAVGVMPIEATSAGADHLRDRFWFMGHRDGARAVTHAAAGSPRPAIGEPSGGDVGHAGSAGLPFRSIAEVERGDLRDEGAPVAAAGHRSVALADANQPQRRIGDEQPAGQQSEQQRDQASRASPLSDDPCEQVGAAGQPRQHGGVDWVIGADGKARRVKSGIRLLAHGIPHRVGLLRGFGNAIDPRPAAAFIQASLGLAP